jgi:hypothetical protein
MTDDPCMLCGSRDDPHTCPYLAPPPAADEVTLLPAPYVAIEEVISGRWDAYIIRVRNACLERMKTPEWSHHVTGGR